MIVNKCPLISSTQPIALVGLLGNFLTHVFITHQKQQMKCSKQLPRRIFMMIIVIIMPAMMIVLVAQQLRMHKTSAEKNARRFCASSLKCDHPKSQLQMIFVGIRSCLGYLNSQYIGQIISCQSCVFSFNNPRFPSSGAWSPFGRARFPNLPATHFQKQVSR